MENNRMTRFCLKTLKEKFLLGFTVSFLAALYGAQLLLPRRACAMEQPYQSPVASQAPIATKGEKAMDWEGTLAHKPSQASSTGSGMIPVGEDTAEGSGRLSQSLSFKAEDKDKDLVKATSITTRPETVAEEPLMSLRLGEEAAHSTSFKGKEKLVDASISQILEEVPTEGYAGGMMIHRGSRLQAQGSSEPPRQSQKPVPRGRAEASQFRGETPTEPGIHSAPNPPPMTMTRRESDDQLRPKRRIPFNEELCSPSCLNLCTPQTGSPPTLSEEEESTFGSRPRGSVVANATRERTLRQERILEASNSACWRKGWVADFPSDPVKLEEMLKQYQNDDAVDWPWFHHSQKGPVTAVAKKCGITLPSDTFLPENKKTTLSASTYAPRKLAAKKNLLPSIKRDNRKKHVKILHAADELEAGLNIYARYGHDHGGELDMYAGKQNPIPCIGLGDEDTGLSFEWSTPKSDRWVED